MPYDGNIDLSRFTAFDVSQIDITKGFSSVLYGFNSTRGAVNIISQKPSQTLQGDKAAKIAKLVSQILH